MFQFIHAADIHLDSPLRGLICFDGAPIERIRSATREAFRNLVQLAIDEDVAFVLIAGDLWDCDWPDSAPGLFFISQAVRLGKAGIPVFAVKGNHDAHSQLTGAIRKWPENVTIFHHKKPHTVRLEKWNVAIHGQSYAQQQVTEDLSAAYPPPVTGAFNIGLLHTCLEDGGTNYAPARVDHLVARAYDYWALGHAHERRDLSRDGVHIEFPGNLQGRSMREPGAKGCSVVTVADDHKVTSRFEALDVVRWQELRVEGDDHDIERIVRQALEQAVHKNVGRLVAVRLHVAGPIAFGQALRDRLDAVAVEVGDVWLEKILVAPRSSHLGSLDQRGRGSSLDVELRELIASLATDDGIASEWIGDFAKLRLQFSGELAEMEVAKALEDRQAFRTLVARVGEQL
jgi:exonuclease SbcD